MPSASFGDLLHRHLLPHYPLPAEACARLQQHHELLSRWNQRINLTAIRDTEEAVLRHYCESVALAAALPAGAISIVDAGSGPGFPGIPIAIARPEASVTLVELDMRKSIFLREATIDLPRCRVFQGRLSALDKPCDWLVSRALHWSELRLYRKAANVALLVSEAQASEIAAEWHSSGGGPAWQPPLPLPWEGQGLILMGSFSATPGS